jgi:hypothetical protein
MFYRFCARFFGVLLNLLSTCRLRCGTTGARRAGADGEGWGSENGGIKWSMCQIVFSGARRRFDSANLSNRSGFWKGSSKGMGAAVSASRAKTLISDERAMLLQNELDDFKQQHAELHKQNNLLCSKILELERLLRAALEDAATCRAQLSIVNQQNSQLQKHAHDQNANVCQQNDRLRLKVSELEARLLVSHSNASTIPSIYTQCCAGIVSGKNRRNQQFLCDLFNRHKDSSGGLSGQNLAQALRDADAPIIPSSDQEIADVLKQFDINGNATLHFAEFQQAVEEPDELQAWFIEKQLPYAADALRPLVGRCGDQLKVFSQLSSAEIEHAAAATCSVIPALLEALHQDLQSAFVIQSQIDADMKADPSKFNDSFKMACGSISDFHLGLTGRVGMPHLNFKKRKSSP